LDGVDFWREGKLKGRTNGNKTPGLMNGTIRGVLHNLFSLFFLFLFLFFQRLLLLLHTKLAYFI